MSGGYTKLADPTVGPLTPIGVTANPLVVTVSGGGGGGGDATAANQVITNDILDAFIAGEDMAGIGSTLVSINNVTQTIAQDVTGDYGTTQDQIKGLLATRQDEGATYLYLGYAEIGSDESDNVWRISRFTLANVSGMQWADGDANYDNVWDNRASLTYL